MSRNDNSLYVKSHTYVTHAIKLQLCKNNYYVTLMQLICDYHGCVMLTLFLSCPYMASYMMAGYGHVHHTF
jgi:hypothetical protein